MITILPAIILPTLLGYFSVTLLLESDRKAGVLERIALAYPLGIGLLTLQMFFLGMANIPLRLSTVVPLLLLEIVLLAAWGGGRRKYLLARTCRTFKGESSAPECLPARAAMLLFTVWIWLKFASVFLETYLRPIYAFDSFTNWSARAKVFYYSNSLLLNSSAYDFFGKGINHSSGNYPPYNPLVQVWLAQWLGNFDEVLVKFWSPFFLLAAAYYLYRIAMRETTRLVALSVVVMFISSPLLSLHATETFGDLPLGVYILFAQYATLQCMRGEIDYLPLAGLYSVMAVFTKEEGLFIAVPIFLTCCYLVRIACRSGKLTFRGGLLSLLLPYMLILPWVVFKLVYRLGSGVDNASRLFTFAPGMALEWLNLFLGLHNFNVVFILLPVFLFLSGRIDREVLLLGLPLAVYALFFLALYVFTVHYADEGRFSQVVFRNTLTYYPAAWLMLVVLYKKICDRFQPTTDTQQPT